ncbi:MAG: Rap1a/Tai family immunity protein [Rubrivivax sp.]
MRPRSSFSIAASARLAWLSLALCAALPASAQRITGSILLEHCQSRLAGRSGFESGLCIGTMAGALEAHDTLSERDERLYCMNGKSISNDHAVRIVVRYLREHPEQLERSAATAVIFAMRDAYPCAADAATSAAKPG